MQPSSRRKKAQFYRRLKEFCFSQRQIEGTFSGVSTLTWGQRPWSFCFRATGSFSGLTGPEEDTTAPSSPLPWPALRKSCSPETSSSLTFLLELCQGRVEERRPPSFQVSAARWLSQEAWWASTSSALETPTSIWPRWTTPGWVTSVPTWALSVVLALPFWLRRLMEFWPVLFRCGLSPHLGASSWDLPPPKGPELSTLQLSACLSLAASPLACPFHLLPELWALEAIESTFFVPAHPWPWVFTEQVSTDPENIHGLQGGLESTWVTGSVFSSLTRVTSAESVAWTLPKCFTGAWAASWPPGGPSAARIPFEKQRH